MVASLYNGSVCVWNHETQTLVKTLEMCDLPIRASKFVARKNWVITGADDLQIRVFSYNTLERVHMFEAHSDYIRCIAVHPTQPFILTSSDDKLIKLWDWDKKWTCSQVAIKHIPKRHVCMCQFINGNAYLVPLEVVLMQQVGGRHGIISLLDWYSLDKEIVLVMERPCMDLYDYVYEKGQMEEAEAKNILKQLVDAAVTMDAANVFHRDIKMENVLIDTSSDFPRVWIIDL
ncbi:uncharacterized protein LOC133473200 isoform X2 [Phyllopteryx taeniolatus]|uniref:uncharacterized protein LOC133473200 isoform X2 n=1 Tax=Phyllopteryx taeniolatus TaxID=161469 RepID=UPI002AD2B2A6|nr:uncharacterized protein LOC133473200 isoform X2 [Phyllopteryx taeniolatus]